MLVLADTHIPSRAADLPAEVWEAARTAEAILHAGDLTDLWVVKALERFAPTYAVAGNVDPPEVAQRLPWRRVVRLGETRVGVTHGHRGAGRTTPERALSAFAAEGVQVVVFGHSHQPLCERRGGILLLNPGSPTDRRRSQHHSCAWLTLDEPSPRADLVDLGR